MPLGTISKMKFFIPFFIAIAVCSAGVVKDLRAGYKEGDRFFYFPGDGDGMDHLVDTQEPVDVDFISNWSRNPNNNLYLLYTRRNPMVGQIIHHGNENNVYSSYFDNNKETIFLAHGWNGNGYNKMNKILTEAFLENGDVNVIVLDWSRLAGRNYVTAQRGTAEVGRGLGQFVAWLTTFGLSYDRVHLVGFSLGGHLVGNAARATNGRVRRVTALDPAGPIWHLDSNRIRSTDAQYVEIIHTNTAFLGYRDPLGDADFYPNGGYIMPGCFSNRCSHSIAYEYMASTVKHNNLLSNECRSLREVTGNRCTGSLNPMGNSDLNKSRTGIFRVNTRRNYPF